MSCALDAGAMLVIDAHVNKASGCTIVVLQDADEDLLVPNCHAST